MAVSSKQTIKSSMERNRLKQSALAIPGFSWQEKQEQYCDYRLDGTQGGQWLRLKQFTNGTLYVEASDEATLQLFQSPSSIPASANGQLGLGLGKTATAKPSVPIAPTGVRGQLNLTGTYVGTDESGKGDYFGSLVIAGVCVNDETVPKLLALGVMDSKKLTDATMAVLSDKIIQIVGQEAVSIVEITPKKYNDLYTRMKQQGKNLNHMLAWGHATVIENVVGQCPDCTQAIADQFGNEAYIKNQLKEKGKGITLYQTPKAEANIGVAAASILARNRFVVRMKQLSGKYGVNLPFGASGTVKKQAKLFVAQHGMPMLAEVAKLHFKTTQELG